jgi:hypothetical protein
MTYMKEYMIKHAIAPTRTSHPTPGAQTLIQ